MTPQELRTLCIGINMSKPPRWHRVFKISYMRCKANIPSNYKDFTLRQKFYVWTGL